MPSKRNQPFEGLPMCSNPSSLVRPEQGHEEKVRTRGGNQGLKSREVRSYLVETASI